ncbi:MAG: undecaprenyl-diphosphate phosphatase [Bacillota bacterium]
MNDILIAVILGIVEGLTEFIPVSSTGHLIIVSKFVEFEGQFATTFNVVIQVGAILSVIIYFRRKLIPFGRNKTISEKALTWTIWKKTIVGVLPALFLGALFGSKIEELLFNPFTVSIALVIGGIFLIIIEKQNKSNIISSIEKLDYKTAFLIGIVQCLAMIPGTSRSAATIIGAMIFGCSRVVAAEFSFFLAIPTMIAASSYSLLKSGFSLNLMQIQTLSVGFIVSFIVALLVIAGFMKYISRNSFKPFGYYRILLGLLVIIYFAF